MPRYVEINRAKTYCNESLNYTFSILLRTHPRHILVLFGTRFLPSDPFTRALGQWLEMVPLHTHTALYHNNNEVHADLNPWKRRRL
jgi:hypothetical protein